MSEERMAIKPANAQVAEPALKAKRDRIEALFKKIMLEMDLDLTDPSIQNTPKRVAKMFIDEIFHGLFSKSPKMTAQPNVFKYDNMLIETNISVNSMCEHHFVPIIGFAHVAYIPGEKVLGLSKFNRSIDWISRRPQVQEKLTLQILDHLRDTLKTDDVAVVIDAAHMCVKLRGVKDQSTITRTASLSGKFKNDPTVRNEFYQAIPTPKSLV